MRSTKFSIISESLAEISPDHDGLIKVSVSSEKVYHAFHAVGLPLLRNCDTVAHPVNAYQKIISLHTVSPNNSA